MEHLDLFKFLVDYRDAVGDRGHHHRSGDDSWDMSWKEPSGADRHIRVWWERHTRLVMFHEDPDAEPQTHDPDVLTPEQAARILADVRGKPPTPDHSKADRAEAAEAQAVRETEAERIGAAWREFPADLPTLRVKLPTDLPATWEKLPDVEALVAAAEVRAVLEELAAAQPPDPPPQRGVFIPIDVDPDEAISPLVLEIAERVLAPMLTMLHHKNTAYGDSAREPLHIFTRPEELPDGLLLRAQIDHKLSRLGRGQRTERVVEDTVEDLLGYLLIYMSERRKP